MHLGLSSDSPQGDADILRFEVRPPAPSSIDQAAPLTTLRTKTAQRLIAGAAASARTLGERRMEEGVFQGAVIAELVALKYVPEQVGRIALLAAPMRPEHAAAMRQVARQKLMSETYPGLEAVWSDHLGAEIANSPSAILTDIEVAVAESYRQVPPPTFE